MLVVGVVFLDVGVFLCLQTVSSPARSSASQVSRTRLSHLRLSQNAFFIFLFYIYIYLSSNLCQAVRNGGHLFRFGWTNTLFLPCSLASWWNMQKASLLEGLWIYLYPGRSAVERDEANWERTRVLKCETKWTAHDVLKCLFAQNSTFCRRGHCCRFPSAVQELIMNNRVILKPSTVFGSEMKAFLFSWLGLVRVWRWWTGGSSNHLPSVAALFPSQMVLCNNHLACPVYLHLLSVKTTYWWCCASPTQRICMWDLTPS